MIASIEHCTTFAFLHRVLRWADLGYLNISRWDRPKRTQSKWFFPGKTWNLPWRFICAWAETTFCGSHPPTARRKAALLGDNLIHRDLSPRECRERLDRCQVKDVVPRNLRATSIPTKSILYLSRRSATVRG
jgi:hypothetical protein